MDTSRATPDQPRCLGMEHPEAAAEVEVEAGLGERVVKAAAEMRLIIWAQSRLLMYLRRLEE